MNKKDVNKKTLLFIPTEKTAKNMEKHWEKNWQLTR